VMTLVQLRWYIKVPELPYEGAGEPFSLKKLCTVSFSSKPYLKCVLAAMLWSFVLAIPGSFYTVYLLDNLNVSYSYLNVISALNAVVLLIMVPFWRRVVQRLDWFKTFSLTTALLMFHYLLLAFVSTETLFLYPVAMIWNYVMVAGVELSFTGFRYAMLPEKNRSVFLTFYTFAQNIAALLGAMAGKEFVVGTAENTVNVLGMEMVNKQYMNLGMAAMMLGMAVLVYFLLGRTPKRNG